MIADRENSITNEIESLDVGEQTVPCVEQHQGPLTFSDKDILETEFPPPYFIVPSLITEGVTELVGKPKTGKSMLILGTALSISNGGSALGVLGVEQREVLYMALEDTPNRLKRRIANMLRGFPPSERIHFAFKWERTDGRFYQDLDAFITSHPNVKVVVIDTFVKIKGRKAKGRSLYEQEYEEVDALKAFADEHKIAIILIHHLRKSEAKDVLDMVSGSVGFTGAADTILIMQRNREEGTATLFATGRDIEEITLGLKFNQDLLAWEISGPAAETQLTHERREVLEMLKTAGATIKLSDIAAALDKKKPVVHKHLRALMLEGLVVQEGRGLYRAGA